MHTLRRPIDAVTNRFNRMSPGRIALLLLLLVVLAGMGYSTRASRRASRALLPYETITPSAVATLSDQESGPVVLIGVLTSTGCGVPGYAACWIEQYREETNCTADGSCTTTNAWRKGRSEYAPLSIEGAAANGTLIDATIYSYEILGEITTYLDDKLRVKGIPDRRNGSVYTTWTQNGFVGKTYVCTSPEWSVCNQALQQQIVPAWLRWTGFGIVVLILVLWWWKID